MDGIRFVADDIARVEIPLPYALNIVNCYLLRGRDGWTLLDTGLNTAPAGEQWQRAMRTLGFQPNDIDKIVLTHMHPDHFGMAGWWQRQADAPMPVYMPAGERAAAQIFYGRDITADYHQWMLDCGMDDATVRHVETALAATRDLTLPHPTGELYLHDGEIVQLGERNFRAMHAPGHADGQLIFYDESDKLLLCGDHVLMRITPNIGRWLHTKPDPLGRYMRSLRDLRGLDVRVALPGHRALITDWRGRIEELLAHHELRLEQTRAALDDGAATVFAVAERLFDMSRLTPHEWRFAMAEALAHVERLGVTGFGPLRRTP